MMGAPTYEQVIQELETCGIMPERTPDLGVMRLALERLGYFKSEFFKRAEKELGRVIIVAGTNGKGSTCAFLEALLLSAGKKTVFYSSPHLMDYTERIRIHGRDLSRSKWVESYLEVKKRVGTLVLSHFEWITLMAVWSSCLDPSLPLLDHLILEVGLGGTWDATNAIPHRFCGITRLGFDHQNLLGNTLVEIASNKFGVVSPGAKVFHLPFENEEVQALSHRVREKTGSSWTEVKPFGYQSVPRGEQGFEPVFVLKTPWGEQSMSLPGRRASENASLALRLFEALGYDPMPHLSALAQVRWPGRMEHFVGRHRGVSIYLSGDHNEQGVQSLLDLLKHYSWKTLHLLAGVVRDKDLEGVLSPLMGIPRMKLYLTETPFRTRALKDYGRFLTQAQAAWAHPAQALREVEKKAEPGDLILVTGSLYLVGAVRASLLESNPTRMI